MNKLKKCCSECAYGGWFSPSNKIASCDCEENDKRFITTHLMHNDMVVECEDSRAENMCEHFIPNAIDDDIEEDTYSITNLSIKCPYCNEENGIYDVDQSGHSDIIECDHCGKKFGYSWGGLY